MFKNLWQNKSHLTIFIILAAIGVRLYGATTPAQLYDIGTFEAWSRSFWVHGPQLFFGSVWSDYLPLPILTFAPISWLADTFHSSFGLTFKLVHVIIELILMFFIMKNSRYSVSVLVCLLLSPALIGDTAFWGQVDTIPALLALLALTYLLKPNPRFLNLNSYVSPVLYGLAVAYKPIMVLIAPILWIVSIKQKQRWWQFPLLSGTVFFATALPFVSNPTMVFSQIFSRIFAQSGTYPFLTVNAFNLWSLVPINAWVSDSFKVLSMSGQIAGMTIFLALLLISLNHWRRTGYDVRYSYRLAATILVAFYMFTTRMHERHLLFGLPFLALAVSSQPFLVYLYLILTLGFTLNLYGAFSWVFHNQTWPFTFSTISLISWGLVIATITLATVWSWPDFFRKCLFKLKTHKILVAILLVASCLRLINLSHPPVYIFDEVYHAFTAREYLHGHIDAWEWWTTPPEGVAYEWTHPPTAKYGMVLGMLLFGEDSFGWRFGSAIAGIISIYGIYLLTKALSRREDLALLAAFLVSIEGLHIAQSRIGMNDAYMLCFSVWAFYLAVKSRWKGSAILYGLALSSKWSALYGVVPLIFIYLHQNPIKLHSLYFIRHTLYAIRLLLISAAIYVLTFAPFILAGHTWEQWWELHRQMWYYHTHLVATHGYQSTPWQWLFSVRPVWYWVNYSQDALSNIYAFGNPVLLWLGLVAAVLQFPKLFKYPYSILYTLYFIFTLPWLFSPRIMFFYHYLPSATFLCLILASWLVDLSPRARVIALVCCSVSLLLISPFLYGFPTIQAYWDTIFKIFPSWK